MNEFRMSALPRYPDGSRGEPFASVSAQGLVICFGAMAVAVRRWLPQALESPAGGRFPSAVELTLEWGGPTASAMPPGDPGAPSVSGGRNDRPPRRRLLCRARRRLACVGAPAQPLRAPVAGSRVQART